MKFFLFLSLMLPLLGFAFTSALPKGIAKVSYEPTERREKTTWLRLAMMTTRQVAPPSPVIVAGRGDKRTKKGLLPVTFENLDDATLTHGCVCEPSLSCG